MPHAMNVGLLVAIVATLLLATVNGHSHGEFKSVTPAIVLAPGYENLQFEAPEPGAYVLPHLGLAADGLVIDSQAKIQTLHSLMQDKVTVLNFLYRACDDVNGCPLATFVMHRVRDSLATDSALTDSVQLLSMSFDPKHDTPEAMDEYAASFGDSPVSWRFLTGASEEAVGEVLAGYGQSVSRKQLAGGGQSINHLLRVYVIDKHLSIRNIYNSSLLHADTLLSDVATLVAESSSEPAIPDVALSGSDASGVVTLSDDRSGYATGEYVSNTRALEAVGKTANLLHHARATALGLPPPPRSDSLSAESISLGRKLFFDRRLSLNDTFSCAMCHIPEQGFTVNEMSTAVGLEGRTVKRNAPTLLNIGYLDRFFHDSREFQLEQQIWSPLLARNEMANPSVGYVINKIKNIPDYASAFNEAFGSSEPTMGTVGKALADYQRALISANSPFDRWHFGQDDSAVSEDVKHGFRLFTGKARCAVCHLVGDDSALFTDQQLHNTGIGYVQSTARKSVPHPVTLAPGVVVYVSPAVYASGAEKPPIDLGLYEVTQNPDDRWKFRTPMLRNVALTAPYMHDGSLKSLTDVINFYERGGIDNKLLSPLITPLGLTDSERVALVKFLESLTGDGLPMLVSDAQAAPIGDR